MKIQFKLPSLFLCILFLSTAVSAQYKQTITNKTQLLFNKNKTIPLGRLDHLKIAVAVSSEGKYNAFIEQVERYADVSVIDLNQLNEQGKLFNTIIVAATASDLGMTNAP